MALRALRLLPAVRFCEQLGFYGTQILLMSYMADPGPGGLGFSRERLLTTYELHALGLCVAPLVGGWLVDRFLGERRALWLGAGLTMAAQLLLLAPGIPAFHVALGLLVLGSGLFSPAILSLMGTASRGAPAERDLGFVFLFVAIQVASLLARGMVEAVSARAGWHAGFGAVALCTALGLGALALWAPPAPDPDRSLHRVPVKGRAGLWVVTLLAAFAVMLWAGLDEALTSAQALAWRTASVMGHRVSPVWFMRLMPGLVLLWSPALFLLAKRWSRAPPDRDSTPGRLGLAVLPVAGALALVTAADYLPAANGPSSLTWGLGCAIVAALAEGVLWLAVFTGVARLAPPGWTARMMGVHLLAMGLGGYVAVLPHNQLNHMGMFFFMMGGPPGLFLLTTLLTGGILLALLPRLRRMAPG